MAFLFGKKDKKAPAPAGLPSATRNLHTSEGTTSSTLNGAMEKEVERATQSPPPGNPANNSITSLTQGLANGRDQQYMRRDRSESDVGVDTSTSQIAQQEANLLQARRTNPNINGPVPNAALYPWSQRRLNFPTPQSNPFPRYGAAVNAAASKDGDIYMMGGLINGSMVKGDLWMVESKGGNLSCYPIATVSEGPGPRVGHASLLVGNAFIVFGGDTKMDDSDTLDDTLYLLNTSSRQWSRASPPGPKPAGRYGHTLNILGSRIYIFGGQVEGTFFNDLIAFDLNALQSPANQWEFLVPNTGGIEDKQHHTAVPPARTNHTVVSYNDQLFLFGGTDGTQWFNDVWIYEPRTNGWTKQDCIGYIPAPREGHSAALVNDVMYIFGGRTEEGTDLGDLAAFRISSRRWYTFQNMGPSPSPRSGHSMTAHGKQIIVLAGEPSSAPRDPAELSMVYVLDTAKIRYPTDTGSASQGGKSDPSTSPVRRASTEKHILPGSRSVSREGQTPYGGNIARAGSAARETPPPAYVPLNKALEGPVLGPGFSSRPPRTSFAQATAGPPPPGQAPTPGPDGPSWQAANRSVSANAQHDVPNMSSPVESKRPTLAELPTQTSRDGQREPERPSREASPGSQGRKQHQQPVSKAKAMEAGEAAPMLQGGPSRQRSQRSQRNHSSIDSSEEGVLGRSGSGKHYSDNITDSRSLRSIGDEPRSPKLNAHQEALMKELEAAKSRNAWYASELALARKAGYHATSASSPTIDERAVSQFADDDRPLIEAFMTMRAELAKVQQTVDQQASATAKKIAEVEHQRDAAVSEAAYARAKLAAHSGSQTSTPQPDATRDLDDHAERGTDISRRLALALTAQSEHKARIESLTNELNAERRARELAEESAEAARKRLEEMSAGRNPMELEALRAELHEAQATARAEAALRTQAEEQLRMMQVDKEELSRKHEEFSGRLQAHVSSVGALEAALAASADKAKLFERQAEQERQQREMVEAKLSQLRSEHEDRSRELETTTRRLKDAEERAETHAKESNTHREALMAGLGRLSSPDSAADRDPITEQRIAALQQSLERHQTLAQTNQEAADAAAQKLRAAEERIAGLEAYQEQSSREGLNIRRQLQAALRDVQVHQAAHRELKTQLEAHQRDASALTVQHNALKELLGERGINMADARRSPLFDSSPTSRFGTPEQSRLRELEQQLQSSQKAHDEARQAFENQAQEADKSYREKLEQLENDYQSAVHYVKGTEKVLKRMKDELAKYKSQNQRLQAELDGARTGEEGSTQEAADHADLTAEREALQKSLDDHKAQMSSQIAALEVNMAAMKSELASVQQERDLHKSNNQQILQNAEQTQKELAQLKNENSMLETRAIDAEDKVTKLLDQVGVSVGNYRHSKRQSQLQAPSGTNGLLNGAHHVRGPSNVSTQDSTMSEEDGVFNDNRGSLALDNLASELDDLRKHWESTNRSYRLSKEFDFERTSTKEPSGGELSDSLASWRKRLDEEENTKGSGRSTAMSMKREPADKED